MSGAVFQILLPAIYAQASPINNLREAFFIEPLTLDELQKYYLQLKHKYLFGNTSYVLFFKQKGLPNFE
ncbi:MAG TPA: hypothetical protein VIQ31_33705, partial [Phormidium sp.]